MLQYRWMLCCRCYNIVGLLVTCFFGVFTASSGIAETKCPTPTRIGLNEPVSIYVETNKVVRQVKPTFIGFNLDLLAFQSDFWDKEKQQVKSDLIKWLRVFPQAVYRYPGGTPANYFNWAASVGPNVHRAPQKLASWKSAQSVDFGFDEYMSFVKDVGGSPWVIVNLQGEYGKEQAKEKMSFSAAQWANYASKKYSSQPVFRWELGNELYIDKWSPQKYTESAHLALTEMSKSIGSGRFVAMLEDYKKDPYYQGMSLDQYNSIIVKSLGSDVSEFALHPYYDSVGTVFIDTVQHRLEYICQSISEAKKINPSKNIGIWLTETARWPRNEKGKEWNTGWWRTSSLEAGISVADLLIGAVQIPEVNGAFIHALASNTGPWAMFHTDKDKQLYPSIIYLTLRLLREHTQEIALSTKTSSPNISGYAGGYDIRAAAFSDQSRKKINLWTINRSNRDQSVNLVIEKHRGKVVKAMQTFLSDQDVNATNRDKQDRVLPVTREIELRFDKSGVSNVVLPRFSIGVLDLFF